MFKHLNTKLEYDDLEAETSSTGRVYTTPTGTRYPSITTVLSILSEDGIRAWRQRVGEEEANRISSRAANRGTAVHSIIEKYLHGEDTTEFLPHIRQSLENLKPLIDKNVTKVYATEVSLYSDHLKAAGTCDAVLEWAGVPTIIDWKTSRRPKKKKDIPTYFMQGSAYAVMWEERTGMPIDRIRIVMDVDDFHPVMYIEKRDDWIDQFIYWRDEYNKRIMFHG